MSAPRVLLLCGGESDEHEVSLSSARSVLNALGDHDVTPLVIDKGGRLLPLAASQRALAVGTAEAGEGGASLASLGNDALADAPPFDVVFPILHGPNGEDGTVQGLLRLMGVPFVGSGVLGSAVGMDKLVMKSVFAAHALPQVAYRGLTRARWRRDPQAALETLDLPYPLFVKPANLGSSVGIARAGNDDDLRRAVESAFRFDRRVIVERGLSGAVELEVAVLGNDDPEVSPVGEIRFGSEFYDYRTKYTEGQAELVIPAAVPDEIAETCRRLAALAFAAVDAAGLARVDFFYLPERGEVWINEINTMPGFTTTSMYPRLWQAAGVSYPQLVERLLELALERR